MDNRFTVASRDRTDLPGRQVIGSKMLYYRRDIGYSDHHDHADAAIKGSMHLVWRNIALPLQPIEHGRLLPGFGVNVGIGIVW